MMSGEGKIAFKQTKDPFAKYAQGPLKGKTRRSSQEHPQAAIGIGVALDAPGSEGSRSLPWFTKSPKFLGSLRRPDTCCLPW